MPYTDEMIANAPADALGQATPDSDYAERRGRALRRGHAACGPFDGEPGPVTEMDALVAYLQVLGKLTDAAARQQRPWAE